MSKIISIKNDLYERLSKEKEEKSFSDVIQSYIDYKDKRVLF